MRSGLAAQVCALSPDDRLIAVDTAGSAMAVREAATVRVWPLRNADLLTDACSRLTRNMSLDEWERTLGARPYRPARRDTRPEAVHCGITDPA